MGTGPVIIGYDGSETSYRVLAAATMLRVHRVLVVHVWDPGVAVDLVQPPIPPVPVVTEAVTMERTLAEGAQGLAVHGAQIAKDLGLHSEPLAVPNDSTVGATLVRLARDYDAPAIVVGSHAHRSLREALVGSTVRELIRTAPCPVVAAGDDSDRGLGLNQA